MKAFHKSYIRIAAALFIFCLLLLQALIFMPRDVLAADSGNELEIRVQYNAERGDKVRVKTTFTTDDLESLGTVTCYYSNVTRVGTVMNSVARGPEIIDIINAAGIDPAAVESFTFRTDDGYTPTFYLSSILNDEYWYYPNLSANYTTDDSYSVIPGEGALENAETVPAILALESKSSKDAGAVLSPDEMSTEYSYRFFIGQTELYEGEPSTQGDITSKNSVQDIYGIDFILSGAPSISGISLDDPGKDIQVGSTIPLSAVIESEYGDLTAEDLTWSSSDPSVASVDEMGIVSVLAEGVATITATADNGVSASVVIDSRVKDASDDENKSDDSGSVSPDDPSDNNTSPADKPDQPATSEDADSGSGHNGKGSEDKSRSSHENNSSSANTQEKAPASTDTPAPAQSGSVLAKEVNLGDEIIDPAEETETMTINAGQSLAAVNEFDPHAAAGLGGLSGGAFAAGAILRALHFKRSR